ncbi:MAG TPA: M20 family metallopeptidase [Thermodesulfobacteriota bacterium]|mgnify:FL=1|nr:M20 family metallopeptidase [Thermodesulfobacteriota bacterium]
MEISTLEYIERNRNEMFDLLRRLVCIQSGTYNKPGVDHVGDTLLQAIREIPVRIKRIRNEGYGDILILSSGPVGETGAILLVGHMDTVFPADTHFNWYREDELKAYGPGVIDMKGGLVEAIFTLKALDSFGILSRIPLRVIFNPDEEIGSPVSSEIIADEARKSALALVLEGGGINGDVVTGRKGRLGLEIHVRGKAGHAANPKVEKSSAILALARKIVDIEAMNDVFPGVTVNIGSIKGGTVPNSIPEAAMATIDIRFDSEQAIMDVKTKLSEIVNRLDAPGTTSSLIEVSNRPLMAASDRNKKLFRIAREAGERLGIPIQEEFRPGTSDASIIAATGTPVLDGLGPIGENGHSDREYMIKDSLIARTKLLILIIESCGRSLSSGEFIRRPS